MKLTIIPIDKAVYKDGVCYSNLDWQETPANIHALQWKNESGWLEFNDQSPNQIIDSLPVWANNALEAWNVANIPIPKLELTEEQLAIESLKESVLIKLAATDLTQDEIEALVS